ncbi:hypothetical protein AKJ09_00295 [Labilithrix luteola]|uniref:Tail specific protease domain-containing protein n=1 Tax=Labilithrix luteola TaxID=1391654 RepID=A0A0K1PJN7_9BACT|nr:hypothetical protein [Labilithrix luteola]AKU93631.1 hypothetical protein AKJ09_00295 [Labilithrix luteola]
MARRARAFAFVVVSVAFVSGSAHALSFDTSGQGRFHPSAVATESFEAFAEGSAVEGRAFRRIASPGPVAIPLSPLPAKNASYRATMFARGNRVNADLQIGSPSVAPEPGYLSVRFFPTGVVTSDGWYEIATAPFSPPSNGAAMVLSVAAEGADGADIDAFELREEGTYRETRACSRAADPVCSADEFCSAGYCRNGSANVPPLPSSDDRATVARYLETRIRTFFGGGYTRQNRLEAALVDLPSIAQANDAWTFWNGFVTAIHRLRDWHTTVSGVVDVGGRGGFPICFVEGDADLSHDSVPADGRYPDVLVSHAGPEGNSGLKAGDRLVAVDGLHPIAFAESLDGVDWAAWHSTDPAGHAEAVERLRILIRRWAHTITVIRCDAASLACGASETLSVDDLPPEPAVYPDCDHRPAYHLGAAGPDPVTHYIDGVYSGPLVGTDPTEALYGMVFDDLRLEPNGVNAYRSAMDTFRVNAKGVVLDHRTGNGGTVLGAEFLTKLFRAPSMLGASTGLNQTLGTFDVPLSPPDGTALFTARATTSDAFVVGDADHRSDLKVALLLARDGSASDWLAYGLSGAANVRTFGRTTAGAFSSYLAFSSFGGFTFRIASGDFVEASGALRLGRGIASDEEILPKQSDLLVGKDTVYERALAWLR